MQLVTVTALIPVGIIGGGAVLDYLCGRTFGIPIANFFPFVAGGGVLMLAFWFIGAVALLASAFRGKPPLLKVASLGSSVLSCMLLAVCLEFRPYLIGLRQAVFAAGTRDEFRKAAQVIHEILETQCLTIRDSFLASRSREIVYLGRETGQTPMERSHSTRALRRTSPSCGVDFSK